MARKKIQNKTVKPEKASAAKIAKRTKLKEPTPAEIKDILQLPEGAEGDEKLEKMLSVFGDNFSKREKLFILFYTSPMSKTCGKISPSGAAAGGSWKSWGNWVIQQPHVRQKINEITTAVSIQELEDIFREDIEFNRQVLLADRTAFKMDNHVDLEDKGIEFDTIEDKKISELTALQKKMVAGFDYDKNGRAHYSIETRASARQALLTYHKLLSQKQAGAAEKRTETVVTLEAIKDKAVAKISVIQHNNDEAKEAGEFIQTMKDVDEEA